MVASNPRASAGRLAIPVLIASAVVLVALIAATLLLRAPGATPTGLAVDVTSSGGNWTLEVVSSDLPLTSRVYFLTRTPTGEPFSPLTTLVNLSGAFHDTTLVGLLSTGDRVVLPQSQYPAGLTYWFLMSDRLLAVGTLR